MLRHSRYVLCQSLVLQHDSALLLTHLSKFRRATGWQQNWLQVNRYRKLVTTA
jgi:hypothetical protein